MHSIVLLVELQNQDPLNPMENAEFVAQLTQLNTLQEIQNLNNTLTNVFGKDSIEDASNLIGKVASGYSAESAGVVEGLVHSVFKENDSVYVGIGNSKLLLSEVSDVTLPVIDG